MRRRAQFREPIGVALETLRAHKMRSFLTLLGIILSVTTLIVVIALISGVDHYIADRVANMGSNVFLIMRFPIITDVDEFVKANRRNKWITWDDYESLQQNLKLPLRLALSNALPAKCASVIRVLTTAVSGASPRIWLMLISRRPSLAATSPMAIRKAARWSP